MSVQDLWSGTNKGALYSGQALFPKGKPQLHCWVTIYLFEILKQRVKKRGSLG